MSMSQKEIEALMDGIPDGDSNESPKEEEEVLEVPVSEDNFDDILAGIAGIEESTLSQDTTPDPQVDEEKIGRDWTDEQINQGIFPSPADADTKVVSQLSAVASDNEEKASQIFDVLSFVLDENNEIQKYAKELDIFVKKQKELLEILSNKFPNVELFKENLEMAEGVFKSAENIDIEINKENMKLFEAMELMQFHDINRQKIERVMSVIRKLTMYLNNLFEDTRDESEIVTAKHIAGDNTSDLMGDEDLDSLIAEFSN